MITIKYKNKRLEKICNDENEMQKFFENDKLLVENLKSLLFHFDSLNSIFDFKKEVYLLGYNLEKLKDSDYYSIRIVPKKNKRKARIILFIIKSDGKEIEIIDIDKEHKYDKG